MGLTQGMVCRKQGLKAMASQGTIEPICLFTKFTFKNWPNAVI